MTTADKLLVFRLGESSHALQLEWVDRVFRAVQLTELPEAPATVAGVIDVQGTVTPVVSVRRRLALPDKPLEPSDRLILVHLPQRPVALLVDQVEGVLRPAPGKLAATEQVLPSLEITVGAVKLDDGMILIYDLEKFLSLDDLKQLELCLKRLTKHE